MNHDDELNPRYDTSQPGAPPRHVRGRIPGPQPYGRPVACDSCGRVPEQASGPEFVALVKADGSTWHSCDHVLEQHTQWRCDGCVLKSQPERDDDGLPYPFDSRRVM